MDKSAPDPASPFVIVSSPGMHEMARSIVRHLSKMDVHFPHYEMGYEHFANDEVLSCLPETVREQHVFFLHPLQHPDPNTALMMMFFANDALKRASVSGITLVTPYFPYLRQDRRNKPRVSISARVVADLVATNNMVKRMITMDMHVDQAEGFFSFPVENLRSIPIFAQHLTERFSGNFDKVTVVSPDFGGAVRARRFAEKLNNAPVAIAEKHRTEANKSEFVGFVGGKSIKETVVIYDDMIDTGGTIREIEEPLRKRGAQEILVCTTHGIFSRDAAQKFRESGLQIIATNSIPRTAEWGRENPWLTIVPCDELLAKAIHEVSTVGGSVSKLTR